MEQKSMPVAYNAYQVVSYAQHLGHQAIGYLQGSANDEASRQYYEGYTQALSDLHLQDNNHPILQLADTFDEAYQQTNDFLRHRPRSFQFPTVFIAPSDAIALGAMKAFRDLGYHIPEDISFIGNGNLPEGANFEPSLTTVDKNGTIVERNSVYDIR